MSRVPTSWDVKNVMANSVASCIYFATSREVNSYEYKYKYKYKKRITKKSTIYTSPVGI